MPVREDLLKKIGAQVQYAVEARDGSGYSRAMQELDVPEIIVCLGAGRCLFPARGAAQRVCPFCLRYPSGRGTSARAAEVARQFVGGN